LFILVVLRMIHENILLVKKNKNKTKKNIVTRSEHEQKKSLVRKSHPTCHFCVKSSVIEYRMYEIRGLFAFSPLIWLTKLKSWQCQV